jgi:hypothetical protein
MFFIVRKIEIPVTLFLLVVLSRSVTATTALLDFREDTRTKRFVRVL